MVATTTFVRGVLDVFSGQAGAFLDAPHQFILHAFDELQVVMRKPRKFLFQPALGDVPVSLGY